jgi:hypothetical protein
VQFSRTEVARIDDDPGPPVTIHADLVQALPAPFDRGADLGEGRLDELAHGVALPGRQDVVVGFRALQHPPHALDIVAGMAPVAHRVEVAEVEPILAAGRDRGDAAGDLAGDEGLAAARALVVEEDSVAGEEAVALAVVDGDPVGVELGDAVGAARVEGGRLALRSLDHLAEELGGGGLVEARADSRFADRLEDADGAEGGDLARVLGDVEAHLDVALRAEVVDLVGLDFAQDRVERRGVVEVAEVEEEAAAGVVRVLVDVVEPRGVEGRGTADEAVDLVALGEEELGEVRAILSCDAGDERFLFRHGVRSTFYTLRSLR